MKDNKLKWSIRGALGIVIIITYFHIMPIFIRILNQLIGLYELSNKSPELKLMLLFISFYATSLLFKYSYLCIGKLSDILTGKDEEEARE